MPVRRASRREREDIVHVKGEEGGDDVAREHLDGW